MNSTAAKITAAFFSVFLIAYVGYQCYLYFYTPYETEAVQKEDYVQSYQLDGFFVRNETVLGDKPEGDVCLSYQYRNGQKVAKNSVIANVYASQNDLLALQKIDELQKQRDSLKESQTREVSEGLKLDLLTRQIDEYEMELVRCADTNDFSTLDATFQNLMLGLNKFNSYVDKNLSFSDTIASLDAQIQKLQAGMSPVLGAIRCDKSGFFSNYVDGYEARLTPAALASLTVSDVEELLRSPKPVPGDSVGKIITDDTWYFVALLPEKQARDFIPGSSLTLKFNSRSVRQVPARVERVITQKDDPNAAVLLSCDYLDENFVTMRFEKPQAILRSYTGIVIPKEAVRVRTVADAQGNPVEAKVVYTMTGQTVNYRFLDILYEDDYVVVSRVHNNSRGGPNYVEMYDRVILKGKDLNDADITN